MERLANFQIEQRTMRYSHFVPRLYNWCISLGFEPGRISPSHAFCLDENQGYPIIMLNKHFGGYPFNYGKNAGVVAIEQNVSQEKHGQDLLIIQASHVGYDPTTKEFGRYKRRSTSGEISTSDCDVISNILESYLDEYQFACKNTLLERVDGRLLIRINNQFLDDRRNRGLMLNLNRLLQVDENGFFQRVGILSTSNVFIASPEIVQLFDNVQLEQLTPIGERLDPEYFYFSCEKGGGEEELENNLIPHMQSIVTHQYPLLAAAQVNTIVEFDRYVRTFPQNSALTGRKVLFVSGLNIDVTPEVEDLFPLTKFVPWAAHFWCEDGSQMKFEQNELWEQLVKQSEDNPHQISLEDEIQRMDARDSIEVDGK